ncbi:SMC-Scp complex subunit ScpB [Acetobacter persici]|uniref:SMC-Scp complex subunit ScpB n=1 Tax=Acetobacter persici TaxID=1076596 RepID=UPI001BAD8AD9|nr:SMC-Scp complex subunit ScpB [Acetobacter persici]
MSEEPAQIPHAIQSGKDEDGIVAALSGTVPDDAGGAVAVPEDAVRLAEALIFAGTEPVSLRRLAELLELRQLVPDGVEDLGAFVASVMAALVAQYEGRGVQPVEVAGGWQFRTAPDLAPALTRVLEKPRRLPRAVMETLAIIAYHQPCTRVEIEEIRGVSLGQTVLDTLIEASLVAPRGRKEVPGRPVLWGTTPDFLRHFGLRALSDLPRREELLVDVPDTLTSASKSAPAVAQDQEGDASDEGNVQDEAEGVQGEAYMDVTPAEQAVTIAEAAPEADVEPAPEEGTPGQQADAPAATVSEPERS